MLYCLKRNVEHYLKLGEGSLFDTREEPAGGWLWTSDDLQKNIDRISLALRDFSDQQPTLGNQASRSEPPECSSSIRTIQSAPFTIQRLAELILPPIPSPNSNSNSPGGIHPHYTTLPKYLRAIQRVLSVSSTIKSFSLNTFTSPNESNHHFSHTHSSILNGDSLSNHNPNIINTPATRRHSTSTPITPILSPVPWLINDRQSLSPELASSSDGHRSRHTSPLLLSSETDERPITPPLTSHSSSSSSPTIQINNITSPTHHNNAQTLTNPSPTTLLLPTSSQQIISSSSSTQLLPHISPPLNQSAQPVAANAESLKKNSGEVEEGTSQANDPSEDVTMEDG
jgi:hypothetical protein